MSPLLPGMYEYDRTESDARMRDTVWPQIRNWDWFWGGDLRPSNENLDWMSDGDFLIKSSQGLIVLGTRVQRTQNHGTLTTRYRRRSGAETEFSKMNKAINGGAIWAGFRIHAYVQPEDHLLLAVYGVRSIDLKSFWDQYPNLVYQNTAKSDGNVFKYVYIEDMRRMGVELRTYEFDLGEYFSDKTHNAKPISRPNTTASGKAWDDAYNSLVAKNSRWPFDGS